MKLLLVEDEEFTRAGIIDMLDWEQLGIDEIESADDGMNGLEIAKSFMPDILLTDVRMPRMNGIDLAFEIRTFIPDCSIIFMSGYSDKEYLKSAIALSAVNYIEKPLDLKELHETLFKTVRQRRQESEEQRQRVISLSALKNQVTLELLRKGNSDKEVLEMAKLAFPDICIHSSYMTLLLSVLEGSERITGYRNDLLSAVCDLLERRLELEGIDTVMTAQKSERFVVVHISLTRHGGETLPNSEIGNICYKLAEILESSCEFILVTGHPVEGLLQLYRSYNAATITLQRGFFYKSGSVLFYETVHDGLIYTFSDDSLHEFYRFLQEKDCPAARAFVTGLVQQLRAYDGTPISLVKDYFYNLVMIIYRENRLEKLGIFQDSETPETLRELLFSVYFLSELEQYINQKLTEYFTSAEDSHTENRIVGTIRLYIDKHYSDQELSVSFLAERFFISISHLCVIFRKETGITVNKYILDRRMEKAKEYLENDHQRIKKVAQLVGFSDANYFNKVFKKYYGLTPLEYREMKS